VSLQGHFWLTGHRRSQAYFRDSVVRYMLYLSLRITTGPFSCNSVSSFLTSSNEGSILLRGTSDGVFSLLSYTHGLTEAFGRAGCLGDKLSGVNEEN
jgi:hypothetical protein